MNSNPDTPRPIAGQILVRIEVLTSKAQGISNAVTDKLEPVCSAPPDEADCPPTLEEPYPPLFAALREHINAIDKALDDIQSVIVRTEL